ncbi:hypothetical protein LMG27174_07297 [Paraburkholderia rhynchosiae]|uniref:Insertion element IS402-like domain-containing protein n=2 Tax=Paraburkholderia rhynchosiae TaxID=487049 RepID=A0A6J5CWH9_9BURK|nr:hypothetical protein LMG27174_07297 [Paraburkholderia rhynchosiae]
MARPIIDDELWALIEPLLPPARPRRFRYPGRKPVANRAALTGILFVLKSGIRWSDLPAEMGCGSGISCWRRLRDWQQAGVWDRLHEILLAKLRAADRIDFSRVVIDSTSVRAVGAGEKPDMTFHVNPDRFLVLHWTFEFPEGGVAVMPTVYHTDIRGLVTALQRSVSRACRFLGTQIGRCPLRCFCAGCSSTGLRRLQETLTNDHQVHAVSSIRGMASDIDSRVMSQMNPASSRATATTAVLAFFPRAANLR